MKIKQLLILTFQLLTTLGPFVYRLGHLVLRPEADQPLAGILPYKILINMWFVYLLQSEKDYTTYIGYTEDLIRRLKEHNQGKTKSIKHKLPYRLVYSETYLDKTSAIKREIELKRNSFKKKELLEKLKDQLTQRK